MTENELRIAMLLLGVSQVSIATKVGVPRSYVHQVITGERAFPEIRQAIAEAIGKPVDFIWPSSGNEITAGEQINIKSTKNKTKKQAKGQKRYSRSLHQD